MLLFTYVHKCADYEPELIGEGQERKKANYYYYFTQTLG